MHFDIKPNNIMISNRNEAMLSDFGLSQLVNEESRAAPEFGYHFHVPPEYFLYQQMIIISHMTYIRQD